MKKGRPAGILKGNRYKVFGDKSIVYTGKEQEIFIDTKNLQKVLKYSWYIDNYGYVRTNDYMNDYKPLFLHRYILDILDSEILIDHIDMNKLNNLEENLRLATCQENNRNINKQKNNISGYKGVYWNKSKKKWQCQISINNYNIYLGGYDNKEVAALVRMTVEKALYKEFAKPTPVPYVEPETLLNSDKTITVIDGNTETSINIKLIQNSFF